MNKEELIQYLELKHLDLSQEDFFSLVFSMLENNPTKEIYRLLKTYLLAYAFVDEDRVARYLELSLYSDDLLTREEAVIDLLTVAKTPSTSSYRILTEFLGEEPSRDKLEKIIAERIIRLSSRGHDDK